MAGDCVGGVAEREESGRFDQGAVTRTGKAGPALIGPPRRVRIDLVQGMAAAAYPLLSLSLSLLRRARDGGSHAAAWATAAGLTAIPVMATVGLAMKAAQDSGGY